MGLASNPVVYYPYCTLCHSCKEQMQTASFDFQMCTFDGKNVPTWPSFYSLSSDLFDLTVCPPASSQLPDREQVSDGSAKAAKSPRFAQ